MLELLQYLINHLVVTEKFLTLIEGFRCMSISLYFHH